VVTPSTSHRPNQTCITAAGLPSLATDYNQSDFFASYGPWVEPSPKAILRRVPTVTVRVQSHVKSCGICGIQSGRKAGIFRVLQFPLPSLIPPDASHPSATRGWYNCPNSRLTKKWTQSHPTPRSQKQEVLGRTNCLLSFDMIRTAKKKGENRKRGEVVREYI
jgi:hypothetical protein